MYNVVLRQGILTLLQFMFCYEIVYLPVHLSFVSIAVLPTQYQWTWLVSKVCRLTFTLPHRNCFVAIP